MKKISKIILATIAGLVLVMLAGFYGYKTYYNMQEIPRVVTLDSTNTLHVIGPILPENDPETALLMTTEYYNWNQIADTRKHVKKLRKLIQDGYDIVNIVIHSPGGRLDIGRPLVRMIREAKAYDIEVNCFVDGVAASMALIILSECSNRYGTFGSHVLWHSVSRAGMFRINEFNGQKLVNALILLNEEQWKTTRVHFLPWYFSEHFFQESLLPVTEIEREGFGYLRVIQRLDVKVGNKKGR